MSEQVGRKNGQIIRAVPNFAWGVPLELTNNSSFEVFAEIPFLTLVTKYLGKQILLTKINFSLANLDGTSSSTTPIKATYLANLILRILLLFITIRLTTHLDCVNG